MLHYTYYRSSAAYRVRIALNLKGLAAEERYVHLRRGEQGAGDYTRLNPQALVPTLVDGDNAIGQSLAIIEYLEEVHPQPALLPGDPAGRARVRQLASIIACEVHPLHNLRVLNYLADPLGHDEATCHAWARHWLTLGLTAFEQLLAGGAATGRFCHGDTPGLADVSLLPTLFTCERFKVDLEPMPTIRRVAAASRELDAFASAHPSVQPDAE